MTTDPGGPSGPASPSSEPGLPSLVIGTVVFALAVMIVVFLLFGASTALWLAAGALGAEGVGRVTAAAAMGVYAALVVVS